MYENLSAKYYQNNKDRLQKKSLERYRNLSKEEKEKKLKYGCERYKSLPEDEKQKLVEYRKKILLKKKRCLIIVLRNYFHLENLQ